ncbi:MAG TPA: hypothetical protein VFH78_00580 [Candidatus Thermoplasmatota archaeon]|nr:hypothetical protein [Candidatus Thermoplasmatota archaeon]
MTPLARVRAAALAALGLALLGLLALALFGIGGIETGGRNPFSRMSALEVGLVAFGAPFVAALATLVLSARLAPEERRRARPWRIVAWCVLALPLVPPLLFMAAMSTM